MCLGITKLKVTKPLLKKIEKWAGNGLNKGDIGILLGYSKDHFYQVLKNSDEMTQAYMVGKSTMKSRLQSRVFDKAMSDDKDALQASTFLLNRHFPIDDDVDIDTGSTTSDSDIADKIILEITSK
jgi:hypothetical protein